jgi:hypothetical protein
LDNFIYFVCLKVVILIIKGNTEFFEKILCITFSGILFTILTVITPLHLSHALANVTSSDPMSSSNKNITTITGNSIKGNGTGAPQVLGSINIMKLPTPTVSTNLGNSIESPDPGGVANQTALSIAKGKAASSNATNVTLAKTQFSLDNLSNSTSTNSPAPSAAKTASYASFNSTHPTSSLSFESQLGSNSSPGFAGLNIYTGGLIHTPEGDAHVWPPDAQIAVGPSVVSEMVNVGGGFWTKTGDTIKILPLSDFFATGLDSITDPRITYDNSSGRWFNYIQDISDNTIRLAVSNSSDPTTASWTRFSFPFDGCPDQPSIGLSKDKMVISANVFLSNCPKVGNEFKGTQFTVVDKSDLLNNRNPLKIFQSKLLPGFYSVHVSKVTNSNQTSDIYMAKLGKDGILGGNIVSVFTINGEVPNIQVKNATLSIRPVDMPLGAPQPGKFSSAVDVSDARIQDASWHQGKLWITAQDRCTPEGDRAQRDCIRLIQIDTTNSSIVQDFDISKPNSYLFFPALAVDGSGGLHVVFGYSSKTEHPSLMTAGQSANGTKNTMDSKVMVAQGESDSPVDRYGDYFGVTADPNNPNTYWIVGQVIPFPLSDKAPFWNTFIANFTNASPK